MNCSGLPGSFQGALYGASREACALAQEVDAQAKLLALVDLAGDEGRDQQRAGSHPQRPHLDGDPQALPKRRPPGSECAGLGLDAFLDADCADPEEVGNAAVNCFRRETELPGDAGDGRGAAVFGAVHGLAVGAQAVDGRDGGKHERGLSRVAGVVADL